MMRQGVVFKFLLAILRGRTDPTLFYQSLEPQKYRGEETDYLNFGDWHDHPQSYRLAAEALAVRLVTFADLSTATKGRRKTIDVGFGFGVGGPLPSDLPKGTTGVKGYRPKFPGASLLE